MKTEHIEISYVRHVSDVEMIVSVSRIGGYHVKTTREIITRKHLLAKAIGLDDIYIRNFGPESPIHRSRDVDGRDRRGINYIIRSNKDNLLLIKLML